MTKPQNTAAPHAAAGRPTRRGTWLAVALVVVVTVLSGAIQGRMRNRWGTLPDTKAAAEQLVRIPRQFGDWRLQSNEQLGETARTILECAGYIAGDYVNRDTGDVVNVIVLLGPPGPIAVHTPEICFGSRNYQSRGERQRVAIRRTTSEDEFWSVDFKLNNLQGDLLRTYYAWSTGGRWTAPDDPRFQYAGQPYLYKIQLSGRLPADSDMEPDDLCRRFLRDFVPVADKYLIDPSTK